MKKLFFRTGIVLAFSLVIFANSVLANDFKDLQSEFGTSRFDAIQYLKEKEIISGYSDGTFRPNNKINRAEFMTVIMRATEKLATGSHCFIDVQDQWFTPYVCGAKQAGIIHGFSDGTFKPEKNITFAEASEIIVQTFDLFAFGKPKKLKSWIKAAETLSQMEVIPVSITDFRQELSRGEAAEMIGYLSSREIEPARENITTYSYIKRYQTMKKKGISTVPCRKEICIFYDKNYVYIHGRFGEQIYTIQRNEEIDPLTLELVFIEVGESSSRLRYIKDHQYLYQVVYEKGAPKNKDLKIKNIMTIDDSFKIIDFPTMGDPYFGFYTPLVRYVVFQNKVFLLDRFGIEKIEGADGNSFELFFPFEEDFHFLKDKNHVWIYEFQKRKGWNYVLNMDAAELQKIIQDKKVAAEYEFIKQNYKKGVVNMEVADPASFEITWTGKQQEIFIRDKKNIYVGLSQDDTMGIKSFFGSLSVGEKQNIFFRLYRDKNALYYLDPEKGFVEAETDINPEEIEIIFSRAGIMSSREHCCADFFNSLIIFKDTQKVYSFDFENNTLLGLKDADPNTFQELRLDFIGDDYAQHAENITHINYKMSLVRKNQKGGLYDDGLFSEENRTKQHIFRLGEKISYRDASDEGILFYDKNGIWTYKEIILGADPDTFVIEALPRHGFWIGKDDKNFYFSTNGIGKLQKVEGITDPQSFRIFDKSKTQTIFIASGSLWLPSEGTLKKLDGIDEDSFEVVLDGWPFIFKDKNGVYKLTEDIAEKFLDSADPQSFQLLKEGRSLQFFRDKENIWVYVWVGNGGTLAQNGQGDVKELWKIMGPDPNSVSITFLNEFELLNVIPSVIMIKDKKYVYDLDIIDDSKKTLLYKPLNLDIDVNTYDVLKPYTNLFKDKQRIYYFIGPHQLHAALSGGHAVFEDVDSASFQFLGTLQLSQNQYGYFLEYRGMDSESGKELMSEKVIHFPPGNIDLSTYKLLGEPLRYGYARSYAKDKNGVWFFDWQTKSARKLKGVDPNKFNFPDDAMKP